MKEYNRNLKIKKNIKISNEQLQKLLPKDSQWIIPITADNFVKIPIKNFVNAGILIDDLICEIYKKENGDIFLELSSL